MIEKITLFTGVVVSDLVKNPFTQFEDKIDENIPTATLQIYQNIEEYLGRKESGTANRCSSATMCVRRRFYQNQGFDGEPLTPRKIVNFMLGDLAERTLLFFIKQALVGPGKLYEWVDFGDVIGTMFVQGKPIDIHVQKELSFSVGNTKIVGHLDGLGKRNSDGKIEVIEIKSAANYGFSSFKEVEPEEFDYLKQAHALMLTDECRTLDVKYVRFFYLRKETGHLWDRVFEFDKDIAALVISEFKVAAGKTLPQRPYELISETRYRKPTGRKTCPWQCGYCSFTKKCFSDYKITTEFKDDQFGNKKPVYIFEDKDEKDTANAG